mgnify:CR=1 FL=1
MNRLLVLCLLAVMLLGRWSHPRKSFPGQVPFSNASCAAATFSFSVAACAAFSNALVMSNLIIFFVYCFLL